MHLARYNQGDYSPGASSVTQLLWHFIGGPVVSAPFNPFSELQIAVLKLFGAKIGRGVRLKPGVRIKFPWRLAIGDNTWIGEDVWIDNLAPVTIGSDCCISQGAYLCTGSHDWSRDSFDLRTNPITLGNQVWIGAKSVVAPGVTFGDGAVLALGSVATSDLTPWSVYQGNPASKRSDRSHDGK